MGQLMPMLNLAGAAQSRQRMQPGMSPGMPMRPGMPPMPQPAMRPSTSPPATQNQPQLQLHDQRVRNPGERLRGQLSGVFAPFRGGPPLPPSNQLLQPMQPQAMQPQQGPAMPSITGPGQQQAAFPFGGEDSTKSFY
jgi:hypothetical protein